MELSDSDDEAGDEDEAGSARRSGEAAGVCGCCSSVDCPLAPAALPIALPATAIARVRTSPAWKDGRGDINGRGGRSRPTSSQRSAAPRADGSCHRARSQQITNAAWHVAELRRDSSGNTAELYEWSCPATTATSGAVLGRAGLGGGGGGGGRG